MMENSLHGGPHRTIQAGHKHCWHRIQDENIIAKDGERHTLEVSLVWCCRCIAVETLDNAWRESKK